MKYFCRNYFFLLIASALTTIPVSYTHLDVYKRQSGLYAKEYLILFEFAAVIVCHRKKIYRQTHRQTHTQTDVYKRQPGSPFNAFFTDLCPSWSAQLILLLYISVTISGSPKILSSSSFVRIFICFQYEYSVKSWKNFKISWPQGPQTRSKILKVVKLPGCLLYTSRCV